MREELQEKLYLHFPEIFAQRSLPMTHTCMCWGFDCGDGWYDLIYKLCEQIQSYINNKNNSIKFKIDRGDLPKDTPRYPQLEATQVKEKYGGLRFYVDNSDEYIDGLISMAEAMSYSICENCSNNGSPNGDGWVTTLCPECRNQKNEKYKKLEEEAKNRLTVKMKDVTVAP